MIIGITGTLGSGKGTVVEYLKSKGFKHYSSSGILKEILTEQGNPLTREYMSDLASELMAKRPGGVLGLSFERAKNEGAADFVLEAIHRPSEADFVRSLGGKILGVDADLRTRYERIQGRKEGAKDEVTFEQFVEDTKREDEGLRGGSPNIRAVLEQADAVVQNNGTLEELYGQVESALATLKT